jgi:putative ABC transport system permease protein
MAFQHDIKQALRGLRRTPGFTAVALLTLAVGIGASAAVFSVLQTFFLKPLPFAEPERLVYLHTSDPNKHFPGSRFLSLSAACYRDLRDRQQVFSSVAAYQSNGVTLTGGGDAERVEGLRVSGSFFHVLGVPAAVGRVPQPADESAANVVVLSHGLWARRFGSDPAIAGRAITINGKGFEVVGVMPSTFIWPEQPQVFVLDPPTPEEIGESRGTLAFGAIGRLGDGVSLGQAQAAMDKLAMDLANEFPEAKEWGIGTTGLWEYMYGDRRAASGFLLLIGVFVLLIATANLANLMISRAAGRLRELAIRKALGGNFVDELRPFFADGLVLCLIGGGLGLLLAGGLSELLRSYVPPELLGVYGLDLRVLGFTLVVSMLTALVAGIVPSVLFSRLNLAQTLRQGGRGTAGHSHDWLRNSLVTAQVALTLALLVSFGAVWRSLHTLEQAPLGFQADHALAFTVRPNPLKYPDEAQQASFLRQTVAGLALLPGVKAVGTVNATPMGGGASGDFILPGREGENLSAHYRVVSPGGFAALGTSFLQGRDFVDDDCLDIPESIIISRSLAARCWPGQDPIGKIIRKQFVDEAGTPFRVIGVVEDVRHRGPAVDRNLETIYWPAWGIAFGDKCRIVVRTAGEAMALVPAIRTFMRSADADLPLSDIQSLRSVVAAKLEGSKTQTALLGLLAGIALSLAAAGIYGVLAFSVSQRTREIGIRKALGGQDWQVVWGIARRGLVLTLIGLGIGVLLTLGLGRLLASQIYGVSATDPLFITLASIVFALVAVVASLIPASRAARMDPVEVLRAE